MSKKDKRNLATFQQTLSGNVYQLKIILLFLWRASKLNKFLLGTELPWGEKFDDAIFYFEKDGKHFVRYLQAKHVRYDGTTFKYEDIVTDWEKAPCNIKKYFISYRKIKQRDGQERIKDLILCTNICFKKLVLQNDAYNKLEFEEVSSSIDDDIFYDSKTKEAWKKYQLKDISSSKELEESLQSCTNLNMLAEELADYLFKDENDANLDFTNYWISSYFATLMEQGIIQFQEVYRFANPNAETDQQKKKNDEIKELQNFYIAEAKEKRGENVVPKELENFTFKKEFIDKLKRTKKASNDLAKLAEVLAGGATSSVKFNNINNVLKCEKEYVFTDNFINGTDDTTKKFRSILLKQCEPKIAEKLGAFEFSIDSISTPLNQLPTTTEFDENASTMIAKELIDNICYDKKFTAAIQENWHLLKDIFQSSKTNMFKFTKNFVKNKNEKYHEFRRILFEMYAKEKLKKQIIEFKQNISNFSKLAKTIKTAYDKAKIHKSDTLKFSQNELKEVKGYLEALNNTVFIASKQINRIMFKNEFSKTTHTIAANFVNELRNQKFTTDEMQDLENYSIEYSNFPPYFDTLDEKEDIKDEIQEFLKLFFIINTPNEKQLLNDISIELGEKLNLLDPMLLTNDLFQIIIDWAKNNENEMIDKDKAIEFIDNLQIKLSTYWITGCSTQYCKKLEEYSISFNTPLNDIMMFLNALPSEHAKILHIATNETLLTAIKVMEALKSTKIYSKKDSFIFNLLKLLLQMEYPLENGLQENHISNTFQSIADLLIVVDYETKKDVKPFCDKLCKILHEKPKKKIIVIGRKESAFASKLINAQNYSQHIFDETKFSDLTPDSQSSIKKNSNVLFQGRNVSLNDLIDENDFDDLIDAETLQTMMTGDEIIIGKPVATFGQSEKDNYHPRKFYLINFQKTILEDTTLTENHIFALEGTGCQELIDKRNSNILAESGRIPPLKKMDMPKCVLLDPSQAKNQFEELCQENQNYFIHWVKFQDEQLIWFHSYVPDSKQLPSKFFDYANRKKKNVDESFFYDYVKQNQNVIISDKAGMGKSTVLTKFSEILLDNQQWTIRINLNQYTDTLLEIKKSALRKDDLYLNFDNFDNDYGKLTLESIDASKSCKNEKLTFANRLFKYFFQKRGIFYIFDGFDEISPDYGDTVLTILQMLRKNIKNRIWIASRTNFKEKLELEFNTFAYDMMPFNKNDQREYLMKFWSNNWRCKKGYDIPNVARLTLYIEKMIEQLSAVMGDIIGIPLQTKMLAEIFQENRSKEKMWQSCFDFIESNVPIEDLDFSNHITNIFKLYEEFFNQKLFKYFLHEKRIVDFTKPYAAEDLKPMISFYEKPAHQIFGILAFDDENNAFKEVLVENEKDLQNSWMTSFKKGGKNIGLIDIFNKSDIPLFNHFTYAEYFCACFLIEKLCTSPSHAKQVFEIADKIFEKDVPVFVECFLYKLKQQFGNKELQTALNGRSTLKFAIDYGLLNCVNVLLNSSYFNDNFLNESGQTVIDYAIEVEEIKVVIYFILYIFDLMAAAKLPDYHFMYYLSKFICNSDDQSNESSSSITNWFQIDLQAFLKEIKEIGEIQVKSKDTTTEMAKITEVYRNRCLQRKYFVSNAAKVFGHLPKILKYLSYDSIIPIMQILNSYNYSIPDCIDAIFHLAVLRYDEDDNKKFKIIERITDKCNEEIRTIFLYIVQHDCISLIPMLLQNYPITESTVIAGIFKACSNENIEIMEILLKYINGNINEWKTKNFEFSDILKTNFKTVKYLLNRINVPVNQLDINDKTILCSAVDFPGTMEIIEYLVEKKRLSDYQRTGPGCASPWLIALENKKKKIVKYFKSKKDVHHITENQNISWHEIVKNGKFPDIETLFTVSGINDKDNNGDTPLHIAVQCNSHYIVKWLLRHGANFEATNKGGKTAEALADGDMKCNLKFTRKFFGYIMNPPDFRFPFMDYMEHRSYIFYVKDNLGRTILHYAVLNRNTFLTKKFVRLCDIEEEDNENKSPLYYAVKSNNFETVKILVNFECLTKFKFPEIPENDCIVFLLQTKKCLDLLINKNLEELKNELKNFKDNDCFNAGIRVSSPYSRCILDYASNNYDLMICLLQCGLNISQLSKNKLDDVFIFRKHRFNNRMETFCYYLKEFAEYLSDQNIDSESLLNYYENTLSKTVGHLLFITDKTEVEKILTNVRLDYGGVTLFHLAAIADASNLTTKLINAGADLNARDSLGNTVHSLAQEKNSLNVIRVLNEFEKAKKDASSALSQI